MSDDPKVDEFTGVETTGHEWDGIRELNNPLPRWWLWSFVISCVWGLGYMIVMPSTPYPTSDGWDYTKGTIGYSQREIVGNQVADNEAALNVFRDQIEALTYDQIRQSDELSQVALASGASTFGDNCAPCHGSGGQGFTAFPNLNDDEWIWGGTIDDIQATITHGIRWDEDDDTRYGDMPKFVADQMISESEASDVAEFVLNLSGQSAELESSARGGVIFEEQCAMCHGESGEGDRSFGAPNLKDAIWLFGGDRATILDTISNGRGGVMPAWATRLSTGEIKELAIYVHSLGGGE